MKNIFLSAVIFGFFLSCSNKIEYVEKSFYYWKTTNSDFTAKEDRAINNLGIKKLYVKYFEVDHNQEFGDFPISKSILEPNEHKDIIIVPTVYIKNEVFKSTTKKALDTLALNVNFLINKYTRERFDRNPLVEEFQMDCDWTLKTKDNYFYFLKKLKQISKKEISCTLRLYPYKYPDKMGVPPVDKATLMCYNLINPLENKAKNSILDINELKLYLNKKRKYPLHLDIALPIYSWMQVYQNNKFSKVLYNEHERISGTLKQIKPMWYEATQDLVLDDFYLRVGDKIKYEKMTPEKINQAIKVIKENVVLDDYTTVTLFHLDEEQLSHYKDEELSGFYSNFSK